MDTAEQSWFSQIKTKMRNVVFTRAQVMFPVAVGKAVRFVIARASSQRANTDSTNPPVDTASPKTLNARTNGLHAARRAAGIVE